MRPMDIEADEVRTAQPEIRAGFFPWYVVAVLILAYIAAFLDRQILSILVEPIKADIGISDVQISLLQGLAFAIFYSVCILPAGWLVDRFNRRNILMAGLTLWCLMTLACGLADSFTELFIARMGVGIGEAVLGPAAYSIIANYFSRKQLPVAMSVYSIGGSVGAGLAYIFGALAAGIAAPVIELVPMLESLAPWQVSFLIVAAPGVPIFLLLMTIRDKRSAPPSSMTVTPKVMPFLAARRRFFTYYCIGIGLLTTVSYANMAWIPSMFVRVHGWPTTETATWLGYMMLLFGTAGILMGGFCAVWLAPRYRDATLRVAFLGAVLLVPICFVAALMPNPWLSLLCYAPFTFVSTSFVSLGPTSIQYITPDALRGRVTGTSLMFVNLIGVAVGPLFIALLTDHVFRDENKLDWALGIGSSLLAFFAALMIWHSLADYRRLLGEAAGDKGPTSP